MSIKYDVVHVRLHELHSQQLTVAPWETPILKALHGDDEVQIVGQADIERDPPDVGDEYARLEQRYSFEKESKIPYVALVYGQFSQGFQALGKEIAKAAKGSKKEAA